MPAFLTDKNNPVGYCVQGAIEFGALLLSNEKLERARFGMDSRRLIQRCTKPDAKETAIRMACKPLFSCDVLSVRSSRRSRSPAPSASLSWASLAAWAGVNSGFEATDMKRW